MRYRGAVSAWMQPWPRPGDWPRDHPLPPALRLASLAPGEGEEPRDPLARPRPVALVEAALMIADEPLPARKLAQVMGGTSGEVRNLVKQLQELLEREGSAFQLVEVAGGFQLLTGPEYFAWLSRFCRESNEVRLTPAARETLAIVAYRQPIARADIEAVRGVQCAEVLRQLMEKNLVRIAGRDDSLGRPVLYGTTKKFLQVFGFRSLKDLPRADEFRAPNRKATPEEPEV